MYVFAPCIGILSGVAEIKIEIPNSEQISSNMASWNFTASPKKVVKPTTDIDKQCHHPPLAPWQNCQRSRRHHVGWGQTSWETCHANKFSQGSSFQQQISPVVCGGWEHENIPLLAIQYLVMGFIVVSIRHHNVPVIWTGYAQSTYLHSSNSSRLIWWSNKHYSWGSWGS